MALHMVIVLPSSNHSIIEVAQAITRAPIVNRRPSMESYGLIEGQV